MVDFIEVNLLPIEYRVVKKDYSFLLDWRIVVPTLSLACLAVAYFAGTSFIESTLDNKRSALKSLESEIAANSYVAEKIKELEKLRDEKNAKNTSLRSISVSKKKWVRIMEGVNKSLPLNMWLEGVVQSEQKETDMDIKGRTFLFPEIAEYMLELEKNEYFAKVSLGSIEWQKESEKASFYFTIKVNLNPMVGIDNLVETAGKENLL